MKGSKCKTWQIITNPGGGGKVSHLSLYFNPGGAKLTLVHYSLILRGASSQKWQKANPGQLQSLFYHWTTILKHQIGMDTQLYMSCD